MCGLALVEGGTALGDFDCRAVYDRVVFSSAVLALPGAGAATGRADRRGLSSPRFGIARFYSAPSRADDGWRPGGLSFASHLAGELLQHPGTNPLRGHFRE